MEQDTEVTEVVFRKWRNKAGGILALFPYDEWYTGNGEYFCNSYEHVGQHGGAAYGACIRQTIPATPDEYANLKTELESIGYNLKVIQRLHR